MSQASSIRSMMNAVLDRLDELPGEEISRIDWSRYGDRRQNVYAPGVCIQAASAQSRRTLAEHFGLGEKVTVYGDQLSGAVQFGRWTDIPIEIFSSADETDHLAAMRTAKVSEMSVA